jgi:hypothetical protein
MPWWRYKRLQRRLVIQRRLVNGYACDPLASQLLASQTAWRQSIQGTVKWLAAWKVILVWLP